MATIDSLPTELLLRILSFLSLQTLRNVRLIARRWDEFVCANQSSVYHHAALLHNFVDSLDVPLPEAIEAQSLHFLRDVPDWYQYCRKSFQLLKNWAGGGDATTKTYGGYPYDIHRIKVDEKHGLVITTHEYGGLTVFDMESTEILWRLRTGDVRRYAHCEYENGFLIFDRMGVSKEVWRLEALYDAAEEPILCRPDETQVHAWQRAAQDYPSLDHRGHFRPWALIDTPELGRAYRFVYPDLLVSGLRKAYLWDVRTAELVLEVENVQGDSSVGDINYVEVSATHIFVCSSSALRIFSRENGAMVLPIKSYQFAYSDTRLAIQLDGALARHGVASPGEVVSLPGAPTQSTALYTASYAEFSGVHVSRDGADLVAQLSDTRVVVIRDFMRVVRGEVSLMTAALEIGKTLPRRHGLDEHFSIYLAFEHGRVASVTTSGVYILTPDPTRHGLVDGERANAHRIPRAAIEAGLSFPHIDVARMPFYADRRLLAKVTCVQMTATKLFLVWDAAHKPEDDAGGREGERADVAPVTGPSVGTLEVAVEDMAAEAGTEAEEDGQATAADAPTGDHVWDAPGIDESKFITDGEPVAGPSTSAAANAEVTQGDFAPHNDNDDDGWQDAEDEEEENFDDQDLVEDPETPLLPGAQHEYEANSKGPIVFCIDFSPA